MSKGSVIVVAPLEGPAAYPSRAVASAPYIPGDASLSCERRPGQTTWRGDRKSARAGTLVHRDALDEGGVDLCVGDLVDRVREQIAVHHHEIGVLPDLDRAGDLIEVVHVGRPHREGRERG